MSKKYELVINKAIGGFALTREAILMGRERSDNPKWGGEILAGDSNEEWPDEDYLSSVDVERHDPVLVSLFKEFGNKISANENGLELIEIDEPEYSLFVDDIGPERVTPKSQYSFVNILA